MTRLRRFWMFVAVLAAGWVVPETAAAQGIRCEEIDGALEPDEPDSAGVERIPHRFGDRRALLVERCRASAGHGFWYQRVDISVWDHGERISGQTLFNGVTDEPAIEYDIESDVGRVRLRYGCGSNRRGGPGRSKWCHRNWQWSSIYDRLVGTSSDDAPKEPEQFYLRQLETSFAREDYDQAAGAIRQITAATGPENADWHMRLNRRFFTEIARRAGAELESTNPEEAAELAARAFTASLPGEYEKAAFAKDEVWELPSFDRQHRGDDVEWNESGITILARSDSNLETADELVSLLVDSEAHRDLAARVLRSAAEAYPEHLRLHLRLADLLWKLDEKTPARSHYRKYREGAAEGDDADLPDRVDERIGKDEK